VLAMTVLMHAQATAYHDYESLLNWDMISDMYKLRV